MTVKAIEEISKAIGLAKHMIVNGEIGEDGHGETWVKRPEGWRFLDRLIEAGEDESTPFAWLELALYTLYQAGEIDELAPVDPVPVPDVPGGGLMLLQLTDGGHTEEGS